MRVRYFFIGERLYRILRVERARDQVFCFDYNKWEDGEEDCVVVMPWIETRKRMEPAFDTKQVAELIQRTPLTMRYYIYHGITEPRKGGAVWMESKNASNNRKNLWNKRMVRDLHDYCLNTHGYRPRKDGKITPKDTPPRVMLEAKMSGHEEYYVKTNDGEFIPVWREPEW